MADQRGGVLDGGFSQIQAMESKNLLRKQLCPFKFDNRKTGELCWPLGYLPAFLAGGFGRQSQLRLPQSEGPPACRWHPSPSPPPPQTESKRGASVYVQSLLWGLSKSEC